MSRVKAKLKIRNREKSVEVMALFDTGSTYTYISGEVAEKIGFEPYAEPKKVPLAVDKVEALVTGDSVVNLEIDGCPMPKRDVVEVIPSLRVKAIVGLDIIEKYDILLDTKNGRVKLKNYPPEVVLI